VNHALVAVGVLLAVIAVVGLYLVFAPLLHIWPHHPLPQETTMPSEIAAADADPVAPRQAATVEASDPPPPLSRKPNRAVLGGERQLERLMEYYEDHTTFQADRLVEDTIGAEFVVTGPVYNVSNRYVAIDGTDPTNTIHLSFADDVSARLAMLKRGDHVTARGLLHDVAKKSASLRDCQFVDK
jgi:hypothetical protein